MTSSNEVRLLGLSDEGKENLEAVSKVCIIKQSYES